MFISQQLFKLLQIILFYGIQQSSSNYHRKQKVLLLRRCQNGSGYYIIPGGTVEENETFEQTAIRELKEEASIYVNFKELLWKYGDNYSYCHYFLADSCSGEIKFGGEELQRQCENNTYEFMWVSAKELLKIRMFPFEIRNRLIEYLNQL